MRRALAACLLLASAPSPAGASPVRYEYREAHMGTQARIVLYADDAGTAARAARAGFARIAALDRSLSDYREDSELMRLAAQAGGGEAAIGEDLFRVLQAAQAVAERSNGAFDVTQGALTRLWRGARRLSELPRPERVAQARALGGHRCLHLDARTRTARIDCPGMGLDVGGIAKGYAVDEALSAVAAQGASRALVALGGDIAVSDAPPGEAGWRVTIAPLLPAHAAPVLLLRHAAVSTAGDAEQWFEADGHRYSHLIDPRSGWPMQGRSATTVIARRGIDADGLDTAAALLGPEAGARLVASVPGAAMRMERLAPDAAGAQVHLSAAWPRGARRLYDGERVAHSHATAITRLASTRMPSSVTP
ncbi:FAD:protein FMN transferase [Luteimonas aquatica]|uniref:FAD:protein FMN transferase n=1 Tax=Luteimonas aquatica TaxID=450364 RepID=UPI001F56F2B4|nr:FAD:protein FMN transferase [Luteimonas aquatica]